MSDQATTWAKAQDCPGSRAKDTLKTLASWADAVGQVWLKVDVLAFEMGCDVRSAQRGLAALRSAGLLLDTGKTETYCGRIYPKYRLPIEDGPANTIIAMRAKRLSDDAARGDASVTPSEGAGCHPCHPKDDTHVTPRGDTSVTQIGKIKGKLNTQSAREPDEAFERARLAYPETGVRGVSGERSGREAWDDEVAAGADRETLVSACAAYAGAPGDWGASGRPKAFHNFLKTGAWRDYRQSRLARVDHQVWSGPREARTAFAALLGDDWPRVWLDPCGWSELDREILARTGVAAERIARDGRRVLAEFQITVGRA